MASVTKKKIDINRARNNGAPNAIDAIRSVAHLADSCAFNHKHAIRHLHEARAALESYRGGDNEAMASVAWNADHAHKHIDETIDHSDKLAIHINKHRQVMLGHLPQSYMNAFCNISAKLSEQARQALVDTETAFRLMDRAQVNEITFHRLHEYLKDAHHMMEEINSTIKELYEQILQHPMVKDEYARLSAHNKIPDKQLPVDIKTYLDETLSLLELKG